MGRGGRALQVGSGCWGWLRKWPVGQRRMKEGRGRLRGEGEVVEEVFCLVSRRPCVCVSCPADSRYEPPPTPPTPVFDFLSGPGATDPTPPTPWPPSAARAPTSRRRRKTSRRSQPAKQRPKRPPLKMPREGRSSRLRRNDVVLATLGCAGAAGGQPLRWRRDDGGGRGGRSWLDCRVVG